MTPDYRVLRDQLRWTCADDPLFRDGADHFQIDRVRFARAACALAPLTGKNVADIGCYPGYGLWAFRQCGQYVGMGRCPDWFQAKLARDFSAEWIDWDFEAAQKPREPSVPIHAALLQEVIEHVRHPKHFLANLYDWLPVGATLYVTTNNVSYVGYILKLLAGKDIFDSAMTEDTVYPGHCTYYSLQSLTDLLTNIGFQTASAKHVNFLPEARFYRHPAAAVLKNMLIRSVPPRYSTHIEVVCRKIDSRGNL